MEHLEYWGIILLLFAVIFVQHLCHQQERKDLYNRIMSNDLTEYKSINSGKARTVQNGIRKNIEEARKKQNSPE